MNFSNKVVIVTGGSSGIGAATAIMFAKQGANVALVGRNEDRLNSVANQCNGNSHLVIKADVTNADDVERIIQMTVKSFGKIDVLVNNAGIVHPSCPLRESSSNFINTLDEIMKPNFRAVVHLTTLATPHLLKTRGNIVNVSSVNGTMIIPGYIQYAVSKAALDHFTKGAALELASSGVRVNGISPGPIRTDILKASGVEFTWEALGAKTALGKVGEADEVAELILYLASDKAKSVTGSNFLIDNGMLLKSFDSRL